jgi:hypothetical protein
LSPQCETLIDLNQIPYRSETGQHTDRGARNELSSWLVAGIVPGVECQPLKKLAIDERALLKLLA